MNTQTWEHPTPNMGSLRTAFALFLGAATVHALCPLSEQRCQDILLDRYSISMDVFAETSEMRKAILEDSVNCVDADLCPLELDAIVGEEEVCTDGFATELGYPCRSIDLMSFIPLPEMGSVCAMRFKSDSTKQNKCIKYSTSTPRATISGDGHRTTARAWPRAIMR